MTILHFGGKQGEKLKKLFAMLGQDNDGEFDNARQKVSDLLAAQKPDMEGAAARRSSRDRPRSGPCRPRGSSP